jgi:hypothetical protein
VYMLHVSFCPDFCGLFDSLIIVPCESQYVAVRYSTDRWTAPLGTVYIFVDSLRFKLCLIYTQSLGENYNKQQQKLMEIRDTVTTV